MNGTKWWLVLFIGLLVVLHFVLRIGFGLGQLAPDLIVVALLLAAREMRPGAAAALGLFLGILDGAVIPFALGSSAIALTVLGYLGSRSRDLVAGAGFTFLALYLFVGKWLFDALLYVATGSLLRPEWTDLFLISPIAALYAALAGLIVAAAYRTLA